MTKIRPAGMSLERAMEIAMEVHVRHPFTDARGRPYTAVGQIGQKVGPGVRAEIRRLLGELPVSVIAERLGVSTRTVFRVQSADLTVEDREWAEANRRRLNLESFRRMDELWEESA